MHGEVPVLRPSYIKAVVGPTPVARSTGSSADVIEFNRRFSVPAAQKGTAFVRSRRTDLDIVFSLRHERTVNPDNTIQLDNRVFQIEKLRWRDTLAGTTVAVHEHLDGRVSIRYGPHVIAEYAADHLPVQWARRGTPRLPVGQVA